MRTPKKWLQDWLGITRLYDYVSRLDRGEHLGYEQSYIKGIPVVVKPEVPDDTMYLIDEDKLIIEPEIIKGYESK